MTATPSAVLARPTPEAFSSGVTRMPRDAMPLATSSVPVSASSSGATPSAAVLTEPADPDPRINPSMADIFTARAAAASRCASARSAIGSLAPKDASLWTSVSTWTSVAVAVASPGAAPRAAFLSLFFLSSPSKPQGMIGSGVSSSSSSSSSDLWCL